MEKKNTVLLTVIAVATLLVAVVGATFAYFTATTTNNDQSPGQTQVDTAQVASVKLNAATIAGSNNVVYPGTKNFIGASVTAAVEGGNTSGDEYTVTYTVNGKVTLSEAFAFPVTYTLYKASSAVTTPVSCTAVETTSDVAGTQYKQTCTVDPALTATTATGTIAAGTTEEEVTLADETIDTDATTGNYYYLVVEYPNENTDQNADMNKKVTAQIVSVQHTNVAQKAATGS